MQQTDPARRPGNTPRRSRRPVTHASRASQTVEAERGGHGVARGSCRSPRHGTQHAFSRLVSRTLATSCSATFAQATPLPVHIAGARWYGCLGRPGEGRFEAVMVFRMVATLTNACTARPFPLIARGCARTSPSCPRVRHPCIVGGITKSTATTCAKARAANKAMLWPPPVRFRTAQRAAKGNPGASSGRQPHGLLDDLYVITVPDHGKEALDGTVRAAEKNCGNASNLGNIRVFGPEGPTPPSIEALGHNVWRGDKPPLQRGAVVLGPPIGHAEYVTSRHGPKAFAPKATTAPRAGANPRIAMRQAAVDALRLTWETSQACLGGCLGRCPAACNPARRYGKSGVAVGAKHTALALTGLRGWAPCLSSASFEG